MNFNEIVIEKFVEVTVEKAFSFFINMLSNKETGSDLISFKKDLSAGLQLQTTKALKFCSNISIFKMSDASETSSCTIELLLKNQGRHFYNNKGKQVTEKELLSDNNNHIILGDPGAGKTTTIKRLLQSTFDILFSDNTDDFSYSFPIIIRLGEIRKSESLLTFLCKELGIQYDTIEKKIEYDDIEEIYSPVHKQLIVKKTKIEREYKIGQFSIENAIANYLNEMNAILFLDGLDEVHYELKDIVDGEIKRISYLLNNSKIIITSRYIADINTFKQFKKNEIVPLSLNQSKAIAAIWLENTDLFFAKLNSRPYCDLKDRPLFLSLLLILFKNNNEELPEQAIDVYRQIILLLIKEWDEDKEYKTYRYSKYKLFDTYKKEDFLAEIAFYLTYELKVKKIFNEKQLEYAYFHIYRRYPQLMENDAKSVIEDIESHNGLIIKSFGDAFEFSHLSLQEYLCAKYLLSIPISKKYYNYLNIYPAPLAIANVLSPMPNEWFAMLFLNNIKEIQVGRQLEADSVYQFIDRLLSERITFPMPSDELGFATLYLLFKFYSNGELMNLLNRFIRVKFVMESLAMALRKYEVLANSHGYMDIELKRDALTNLYIDVPQSGKLKANIYNSINLPSIR